MHASEPQCAGAVLMVRPAAFDYNPQTAASNPLQHRPDVEARELRRLVLAEFDGCVQSLRRESIRVCVAHDTPQPRKPDAVFPNNWVSFHSDGTVVLYPMQADSRRAERRRDIIEQAARELGYPVRRTLDLSHHERVGRCLEGTGSLVLDRPNRIAYACHSPRTDAAVFEEWAREMRYTAVPFAAEDQLGRAIYHTNVMMCIGARFALVATQSILPGDRGRVLERLAAGGREIIEVGRAAVEDFGANVLELGRPGPPSSNGGVLVMSSTAHRSIGTGVLARLAECAGKVLVVPVPTIERIGGGGVRCMLAEVFCAS